MAADLTLTDVILEALRKGIADVRVAIPGRVTAVDAARGRVTVRPQSTTPRPILDQGTVYDELPDLPDVPVRWPATGTIEFIGEITVGDPGLIVFSDVALGTWLSSGNVTNPPVPESHGLSGAVFEPGLFPSGEQPTLPSGSTRARVGLRQGARVEWSDGQVRVVDGGIATELALKSDVQALIDAITNAVPSPSDGGLALQQGIVAAVIGIPVGTNVLKGE